MKRTENPTPPCQSTNGCCCPDVDGLVRSCDFHDEWARGYSTALADVARDIDLEMATSAVSLMQSPRDACHALAKKLIARYEAAAKEGKA